MRWMRCKQSRLNSSIRSDEGVAPYRYSGHVRQSRTKALTYPDGVGYHHEVISSCTAGFIPSKDGYIRNAGGHFFGGGGAELGGERQGASFRPCGRNYGRSDECSVTYAAVALPQKMLCVRLYTAQLIYLLLAPRELLFLYNITRLPERSPPSLLRESV